MAPNRTRETNTIRTTDSITVTFGSSRWVGETIDLREGETIDLRERPVDPSTVATAIESADPVEIDDRTLDIDCPEPGPVHDRVGVIVPDRRYEIRTALAAVARERGYEAPEDEEIERIEAELSAVETHPVDARTVRRRLAELDTDTTALEEEVAALRGKIQARREDGADVSALQEQLQAVIGELTDAETDRIAAEQALDAVRSDARADRDRRERRLRLQDRRKNRQRAARDRLAARLLPTFERALTRVPGAARDPDGSVPTGATAALAVCRIAPIAAPVVICEDSEQAAGTAGRYPPAEAAAGVLDAPVILVER